MFKTPYLNIWNPICKKYQWVIAINIFKNNQKNNYYYVVRNDSCKCNINKYLVVSDEQVFRYYKEDKIFNNWVNKMKVFPEPELGNKNVYTNKYEGINMIELHNYAVLHNKRYVKPIPPVLECKIKNELK
jgi:hypothetical protein